MFSEKQRCGLVSSDPGVAAAAALGAELDSGLQLLAELVQGPGAGLQALGQFLNLGLQHGLANPGGPLRPPGEEEAAGAEEDDAVDRVVQRDRGVPPALQQLAVPAALAAAEELEAAQDLAHLVLAGGGDLLHPAQLPGMAEDQGQVGRDGDGASGRGHPQPDGRRHQRGPQRHGAEREPHDRRHGARRAQRAPGHVGRQGAQAEALEAPGHVAQAQYVAVQAAAAVQQQPLEAAQRVGALQLPRRRLHALRGHTRASARVSAPAPRPARGLALAAPRGIPRARFPARPVRVPLAKTSSAGCAQPHQFSGP